MSKLTCKDCKKPVEEILEYQIEAQAEGIDVESWVRQNDNLYDASTNTVICTGCYVKGIIAGRYR